MINKHNDKTAGGCFWVCIQFWYLNYIMIRASDFIKTQRVLIKSRVLLIYKMMKRRSKIKDSAKEMINSKKKTRSNTSDGWKKRKSNTKDNDHDQRDTYLAYKKKKDTSKTDPRIQITHQTPQWGPERHMQDIKLGPERQKRRPKTQERASTTWKRVKKRASIMSRCPACMTKRWS